jgi:hypothetical protein
LTTIVAWNAILRGKLKHTIIHVVFEDGRRARLAPFVRRSQHIAEQDGPRALVGGGLHAGASLPADRISEGNHEDLVVLKVFELIQALQEEPVEGWLPRHG